VVAVAEVVVGAAEVAAVEGRADRLTLDVLAAAVDVVAVAAAAVTPFNPARTWSNSP